jgi:hypothetical protein
MTTESLNIDRKLNPDGTINSKYVDLLEEDKAIAGQKFACISFISPGNILKKKELFLFEHFLKYFDFDKSMKKFMQFLNFISYKYNLDFDTVSKEFQEFTKSEKQNLIDTSIEDEYKNFLDKQEDVLDQEFSEIHNFRTNTSGLKIRGNFPTQEEAELRCKMLREVDPNHDIYVGPVGTWIPWEPKAYKTGRVEYLEEELNKLMSEKIKNEDKAKQEFEERVKEKKRAAIAENIKLAKESGNKLTQNITQDGELIGVSKMSTIETKLASNDVVDSANIRKELFEGDNIRTKAFDKEHAEKEQDLQQNDDTTNIKL